MATVEHRELDFGLRLKRAREARGIPLRHIADRTKLSMAALEAIERNDVSRLPGGIFSRAFVRAYALEIGMDPEQTVRDFIAAFPHDLLTAGAPHRAHDDGADDRPRRAGYIALAGILLLFAAAAALYFLPMR